MLDAQQDQVLSGRLNLSGPLQDEPPVAAPEVVDESPDADPPDPRGHLTSSRETPRTTPHSKKCVLDDLVNNTWVTEATGKARHKPWRMPFIEDPKGGLTSVGNRGEELLVGPVTKRLTAHIHTVASRSLSGSRHRKIGAIGARLQPPLGIRCHRAQQVTSSLNGK